MWVLLCLLWLQACLRCRALQAFPAFHRAPHHQGPRRLRALPKHTWTQTGVNHFSNHHSESQWHRSRILTLAPSLPAEPGAPRAPVGPAGPLPPRSPGKPLSPCGTHLLSSLSDIQYITNNTICALQQSGRGKATVLETQILSIYIVTIFLI